MPTLIERLRRTALDAAWFKPRADNNEAFARLLGEAADRLDEAVRFLESCDCPVCLKLAGDDGDSHSDGCAVGAWLESIR